MEKNLLLCEDSTVAMGEELVEICQHFGAQEDGLVKMRHQREPRMMSGDVC